MSFGPVFIIQLCIGKKSKAMMEIEGIPPATEMKETVEGLISSHRVTQPAVAYILAIVVSLIVCIAAMIVMEGSVR